MSDFREELRVGKQILARVVEAYRKIRNTLPLSAGEPLRLRSRSIDLVAVDGDAGGRSLCAGALRGRRRGEILDAYDALRLSRRSSSAQPVDDRRPLARSTPTSRRIGCTRSRAGSPERRSAQTAMYLIADGLSRLLAPILPVTADELWRHLPGPRDASVHLAEFPPRASVAGAASTPSSSARWQRLIADPRRGEPGARGGAPGQDDRQLARCARRR